MLKIHNTDYKVRDIMSKNIEINYKSDVGYEILYPIVQTSSLLPGTLSGQFVFDTAPKSNVAASADDELLRLGEGRSEIESYWLKKAQWNLEVVTGQMSDGQQVTVELTKNISDYMMIAVLCYCTYRASNRFYIQYISNTINDFALLFPFKQQKFSALVGGEVAVANSFSQLNIGARDDDVILQVYTF